MMMMMMILNTSHTHTQNIWDLEFDSQFSLSISVCVCVFQRLKKAFENKTKQTPETKTTVEICAVLVAKKKTSKQTNNLIQKKESEEK